MATGFSLANNMWALSLELLDGILGIGEIRRSGQKLAKFDTSVVAVLAELGQWGLRSPQEFNRNYDASRVCHDLLCLRDGYAAWHKPGQTVEDVRKVFCDEVDNLTQVVFDPSRADLSRAEKFLVLLNDWSMGEVMREHREAQEERHPDRRWAS